MKANYGFGLAAIVLAILFPIYWLAPLTMGLDNAVTAMRDEFMTLDGWDALFAIIGVLEIAVYLGLRRYFRDQINGSFPANMLLVMAILVGLFHCTLFIDIGVSLGLTLPSGDSFIFMMIAMLVVLLGLYTFALLALSIAMLVKFDEISVVLKTFTIGAMIAAMFQLSIVFAMVNIVLFPGLMLLLAIHFFRGDSAVEVV